MTQKHNDFSPISNTRDEYNWDYGKYNPIANCVSYDLCDNFDGCENIYAQQPRRRRPILPRSWFGRPTAPPESATTYKCSYYRKCYSKRCPIWPRNHFHRSCAPPSHCTMNQLSYACRLRYNMWY
ncbi:uncharacterized protein LOC105213654 [Zeugodacus cucurbitae]|uniref:Diacylglycerol kinase gamma n=1 Tax=Zeugodacus cucurbitae TaxID=28588 RepID=A0A0A1WK69_ZEUCU|nr:uncharacterized protein LOC105213654 [Zeugodacus cucurbitae]